MPILYARDGNNGFVVVPGLIGPRGPQGQGLSAYDAAKEAGYTGTEEEFNAALADIENKANKATGHSAGNLAALDEEGNPVDSGKKAEDFANAEETKQALKDKLSQGDLQEAVDDALAQAKESGEFDGEDGKNGQDGVSCTHQWNGTTLVVTSASGTSEADLKGPNGDNGKSAYQSAQDGGYTGTESQFNTDLAEVSNKAGKSSVVTATLLAANWTGDAAPYTYTLTVNGITATSNQEFIPGIGITADQLAALQGLNTVDGGQAANTATILAFGTKPSVDIPIRVVLRGDG